MTAAGDDPRGIAGCVVERGRWLGVGLVAVAALIRFTSSPTRLPSWDLDPMLHPPTELGMTPSVGFALDAMVLLGAGLVARAHFAAKAAPGRVGATGTGERDGWRWRGPTVALWCIAAAALAVTLHGWFLRPWANLGAAEAIAGSLESRVRGLGWVSAALSMWAVAVAAAANARLRRTLVVTLAGFAALPAAKAMSQSLIELPALRAAILQDSERVVREAGYEPGSPAANVHLRKITKLDATGWLGLANPFGVTMAALGMLTVGALLDAQRRTRDAGETSRAAHATRERLVRLAVLAAPAVGAFGAVGLTRSKAAMLGAAVALAALLASRFCRGGRRSVGVGGDIGAFIVRRRGAIMFAAAGLAIAAVALRPLAGVDGTLGGERSFLFRSFYAAAAVELVGRAPAFGVGPGGFQAAYASVKPAAATEAANDAHQAPLMHLATLGPLGLGFSGAAVALIATAHGRRRRRTEAGADDNGAATEASSDRKAVRRRVSNPEAQAADGRRAVAFTLGVVAVVAAAHVALHSTVLLATPTALAVVAAGFAVWAAAGGVAVTVVAGRGPARQGKGHADSVAVASVLAGVLMVGHAMIDVTLTLAASASLGGVLLGLAIAAKGGTGNGGAGKGGVESRGNDRVEGGGECGGGERGGGQRDGRGRERRGRAASGLIALTAAGLAAGTVLATAAWPAWRWERALADAAAELRPIARSAAAQPAFSATAQGSTGSPMSVAEVLRRLDAAAAGVGAASDALPDSLLTRRLHLDESARATLTRARAAAAGRIEPEPAATAELRDLAIGHAAALPRSPADLTRAARVLLDVASASEDLGSAVTAPGVTGQGGVGRGGVGQGVAVPDPSVVRRDALRIARAAAEAGPRDSAPALTWFDAARAAGEVEQVRAAAERALAVDRAFELDPAAQLSPQRREALRQALGD